MTLVPSTDLTDDQIAQVRLIFKKAALPGWIESHRFWVQGGTVQPRAARHVNDSGWKLPPLPSGERRKRADRRDRGVLNEDG